MGVRFVSNLALHLTCLFVFCSIFCSFASISLHLFYLLKTNQRYYFHDMYISPVCYIFFLQIVFVCMYTYVHLTAVKKNLYLVCSKSQIEWHFATSGRGDKTRTTSYSDRWTRMLDRSTPRSSFAASRRHTIDSSRCLCRSRRCPRLRLPCRATSTKRINTKTSCSCCRLPSKTWPTRRQKHPSFIHMTNSKNDHPSFFM